MLVEILEPIKTKSGFLPVGEIVDVPEATLRKLGDSVQPLPGNDPSLEPEWQYDFCTSHAEFNHWRGSCPCSLDDCLLSKFIDTGEDLDKMRGLEIGQGVTTDQVIDRLIETDDKPEMLIAKPLYFILLAKSLAKEAERGQDAA